MKWSSSTYRQSTTNTTTDGADPRSSFTGKEKDAETGYGYFGARYMDHELMTMWLSVDPMADKYPGISPYAYCAWNPVKLVDPDGNDWYDVAEDGTITRNEEKSQQEKYKNVDVLHSTYSRRTSKEFKKGTLGKISSSMNLDGSIGQCLEFGENSTTRDQIEVFMFCADNSNVEYSLIGLNINGNERGFLTTSHDLYFQDGNSSDDYGSAFTKHQNKFGANNPDLLIFHIHNHWANGTNGYGPSDEDRNFKEAVLGLRSEDASNNPYFGIYKCGGDEKSRGIRKY